MNLVHLLLPEVFIDTQNEEATKMVVFWTKSYSFATWNGVHNVVRDIGSTIRFQALHYLHKEADKTSFTTKMFCLLSVCSHMERGVFMLFGSRRFESSSVIESYTQAFHMPYISPSFADNVVRQQPTFQIHMRPSHTRALVDVIMHFSWRNFHYVYDSEEGKCRHCWESVLKISIEKSE